MITITVITVCFNNLNDVINTCNSIDIQTEKPFEHLIIDGSTTPGIKIHLEKTNRPCYRNWICEPDKGIADAFNKGIKNAKGNVVVMLNAGDTFFDSNAIETALCSFKQYPSAQWLHARFQLIRGDQKIIIGKPFSKHKLYRGMRSVCHQTMFVKKILHSKYGLYNIEEKIGMDYDFLCRISNEPFVFVKAILANFAPDGISSLNYLQSLKDMKRIYQKYFGKSFRLFLWQIRLKFLYYLLHSPAGFFLYKIKLRLKLENI